MVTYNLEPMVTLTGIKALRAEWFNEKSRFVVIRYKIGNREETGLRLDLDKCMFLDHDKNEQVDNLLRKHVDEIREHVVNYRAKERAKKLLSLT